MYRGTSASGCTTLVRCMYCIMLSTVWENAIFERDVTGHKNCAATQYNIWYVCTVRGIYRSSTGRAESDKSQRTGGAPAKTRSVVLTVKKSFENSTIYAHAWHLYFDAKVSRPLQAVFARTNLNMIVLRRFRCAMCLFKSALGRVLYTQRLQLIEI